MLEQSENVGTMVTLCTMSCVLSYSQVLLMFVECWGVHLLVWGALLGSTAFWAIFQTTLLSTMSEHWNDSDTPWILKLNVLNTEVFKRLSFAGRILIWLNMFFLVRRVLGQWKLGFEGHMKSNESPAPAEELDPEMIGRPIMGTMGGLMHNLLQQVDHDGNSDNIIYNDEESNYEIPTRYQFGSEYDYNMFSSKHAIPVAHEKQTWTWASFLLTSVNILIFSLVILDISLNGYLQFSYKVNIHLNTLHYHQWAQKASFVTTVCLYLGVGILMVTYVVFVGKPKIIEWNARLKPFLLSNSTVIGVCFLCLLGGFVVNILLLTFISGYHDWLSLFYITLDFMFIYTSHIVVSLVHAENSGVEQRAIIGRLNPLQIH